MSNGHPEHYKNKSYLGDGLYVGTTYGMVLLYTHDGNGITNECALEPEVLQAFFSWLERSRGLKITVETREPEAPQEDHDPTPYCLHCGAMRASQCKCGPIPEND